MKKLISIIIIGLSIGLQTAGAQLASKKGVSFGEVSAYLNSLKSKDDETSRALLLKEAKALSKSSDELLAYLATNTYEFLDKIEEAEMNQKSILKRFPKGLAARNLAYTNLPIDEKNFCCRCRKNNRKIFTKISSQKL